MSYELVYHSSLQATPLFLTHVEYDSVGVHFRQKLGLCFNNNNMNNITTMCFFFLDKMSFFHFERCSFQKPETRAENRGFPKSTPLWAATSSPLSPQQNSPLRLRVCVQTRSRPALFTFRPLSSARPSSSRRPPLDGTARRWHILLIHQLTQRTGGRAPERGPRTIESARVITAGLIGASPTAGGIKRKGREGMKRPGRRERTFGVDFNMNDGWVDTSSNLNESKLKLNLKLLNTEMKYLGWFYSFYL